MKTESYIFTEINLRTRQPVKMILFSQILLTRFFQKLNDFHRNFFKEVDIHNSKGDFTQMCYDGVGHNYQLMLNFPNMVSPDFKRLP